MVNLLGTEEDLSKNSVFMCKSRTSQSNSQTLNEDQCHGEAIMFLPWKMGILLVAVCHFKLKSK